jgi:hypothetical protein
MTVPAVVDKVLAAVNSGDTDAFLDLFSADGEVDDWGSIYSGKKDTDLGLIASSSARRLASL